MAAGTGWAQDVPKPNWIEPGKIVIGNARFTAITPECVRMEYAPDGGFIDAPSLFAVNRNAIYKNMQKESVSPDGEVVLALGKMRIFYRPAGEGFTAENLRIEMKRGDDVVVWKPGDKQRLNLGGTIHTLDQVKGPVDLGEGLLSRDGWYLIDDSRTQLFTKTWVESRPKDAGTDWYFFGYGEDYKGAFEAFTAIGGRVPMPRKYVLGSWYSRWWEYSSDDYKQIVREYDKHDFPLDIMVMDMEWHKDGWTGWSWNRELIPDPAGLLNWFHDEGLAVTLNVHPHDGVKPHEDMYEDFMRDMGADPETDEPIPFDASNEKYMRTLFKHTHDPHEKIGVDFWWLDWQQDEYTRGMPDLLNLTWLNLIYFQQSKKDGERGLQFSRWGTWGDHRHPIHFSGDADTGFLMLGFEVPFTSTAGNVGCFFWSHDIGGHFGERNEEPYTRWVQFAATSAAMRLHSGIIEYLDRRPWKWEPQSTESMRRAFHLRSELMPYIYSSVWECYKESLPLTRPMYIEYPDLEIAYRSPQEFLLGDALLAAPIASYGSGPGKVASQLVWFPKGTWYNVFTNEKFDGNSQRLVCADIDEFPLYARGGVPIPMQPYTPRMATTPLDELVVRAWPGEKGTFILYEDDGVSQGYEKGEYALTELSYARTGKSTTVTIAPAAGSFKDQPEKRSYRIELPGLQKPTKVMVGDTAVKADYNATSGTVVVSVPEHPIRERVVVSVEADLLDPAVYAKRALDRRVEGVLGKPGDLKTALLETKDPQLVRGLMALAGVGIVENPTAYPKPEVIERLVKNDDALIDAEKFVVSYETHIAGTDDVVQEKRRTVRPIGAVTEFNPPSLDAMQPPLFKKTVDSRMLKCEFEGKEIAGALTLGSRESLIREWHYLAPLPYDEDKALEDQVYPPEEKPFLTDPTATHEEYSIEWKPIVANDRGMVELHVAMPKVEDKIAYAYTTIEMDEASTGVLGFRSDDGIEAWLNGERIHYHDVHRGAGHEWELVPVTLKEGANVLLLKISQGNGNWEFSVLTKGSEERVASD
ncbi:DUF5110 domain-containing protein [bacterium]|nr:DUF5110 domain-containing protein [bacterium]